MFIKLYLQAGLGNQLFMIFALVSYAIDNKINHFICSYVDKTLNGTKTYWNTFLDGFKSSVRYDFEIKNVYEDPSFEFNKIPSELSTGDYTLKGFFQSYKYFEHNFDRILSMMNFEKKMERIRLEYGSLVKNKTIALHFRIGDYIGLQNYHCIKGPDYYINALRALEIDLKNKGENIEDYTILYFCQKQDHYYVEQIINVIQNMSKIKYNFVQVSDDIEDWKQMMIMSLCDHFIIANSTFSWFGAYFCNKKDKLVYYPKVWFGPALINTHNIKDLCPPDWKAII